MQYHWGDQDLHLTPAVVKPFEEATVWTHRAASSHSIGFPYYIRDISSHFFFLFFWSLGRRRLGWPGTAQWDKSGHLSEVCTLMLQDCGPQGCKLLSWRKNEALTSFYEFMGKLRHGRLNQMSVVEPRHSLFFFQLQPSALKRKTLLSLHCFRIASSRFHTLANT